MLDAETKRRIDTARDILVGKVPDPKSQVEQITIALIYKFMDDMDAQSEALGGQRGFFAGAFANYGWAKLMRGGLGGYEMIERYMNAIAKMPENPGIPPLFRDIFNNAFLPYRDPETLRAFLKVIDEFEYDHSERLGDAFEYLLSVLGSQGDAGQFRTPRHIIDFMVALLDPKKDETVLDPACGTAGFLISSYKHILAANADDRGQSTLSLDDKGRLAVNFRGYDISPDMVRLSLVNLYLHGFVTPQIHEYDTLTSEERWADRADVILANPPFMSPKGGIRPHSRFSVKSKRSEVLFVDYIAEHLTPTGRAGIIIPEGIIFQGQNAHKQLRKMLIEDSLIAVVSLPAGVFQPYSGVKTSILILDKSLAKKTDRIAFFKVANDGFDLGAQRRPIAENDLPQVQAELAEYLRYLRTGESADAPQVAERGVQYTAKQGIVVGKARIAEGGEYNLSGERYRESRPINSQFKVVALGEVCEIRKGTAITRKEVVAGPISVIAGGRQPSTYHNEANRTGETITVSASGAYAGFVAYFNEPIFASDCSTIKPKDERLISAFVFHALKFKQSEIHALQVGMGQPHVYPKDLSSFQIPLPPLEVQREIVAEIEGYQRVIDGARAVVENYRPHIAVDPKWPMVEIGELTKPQYGFTASAQDEGDARFIRITDIAEDGMLRSDGAKFVTLTEDSRELLLTKGDILVARTGATYGKTMLFDEEYPAVFASYLIRLRFPPNRVQPSYYWAFAQSDAYWNQAQALVTGGGQPQFNGNALKQIEFPIPPLATQQAIVAEIKAEQALVDGNRELIERFEEKIRDAVGRVWGEDEAKGDRL